MTNITKTSDNVFIEKNYSNIQKLTISGIIIALYCVIMYFTQSFAFGPYQVRIATSLYGLAYLFPFLIVPLGLANFLSNVLGGLGVVDMIGGCLVGILTSGIVVMVKKCNLPKWCIAIPIVLVPGTIVPVWLSYMNHLPYGMLVVSLCIGQIIPSITGVILIKTLDSVLKKN